VKFRRSQRMTVKQALKLLFSASFLALLMTVLSSTSIHAKEKIVDILKDEINREMASLSNQEIPPYFISYTVGDVHNVSASASFGAITSSGKSNSRLLRVEVRVGDYGLDNTHELRDQFSFSSSGSMFIARDDNEKALKTALWQETGSRYREAIERLSKVRTNVVIKIAEEDSSADFSREISTANYYEAPLNIEKLIPDIKVWEDKIKRFSALFLENDNIYGGQSSFSYTLERKHLVTSEGSSISQNAGYARISVNGFIKSDDGMELPLYRTYFAFKPSDLPADDEITADINALIAKLGSLREAPVVAPYTGPAILSGRASAVFFHEILGHRVEGHRQKSESEGQTFKKHVGELILPEHMDIVFDPTLKTYGDLSLMGHYRYDDEGIEARPVKIVTDGVLENFLMGRSPIENFPISNGHGRAQSGRSPVARQSNMIVSSSAPTSDSELRAKLLQLCKEQDKEFGLLIEDIQGGFTFTGRTIPNVFNLMPTEVYRVYTDGRPDELVRGVDLVGTPLVMFSMISDAGESVELFNGICGAESGSVPVAAVSPSLLVSRVEVQKKSKSQERPPILPRPDADNDL